MVNVKIVSVKKNTLPLIPLQTLLLTLGSGSPSFVNVFMMHDKNIVNLAAECHPTQRQVTKTIMVDP